MEPTDNLIGSHCSRSGDYGCSAGTFNQQQEQEEDLMSSSLFMLSADSPPSSLWLTLPPEEGFAAPENFGDGQISSLAQMPFIPPSPLVATHGREAGQLAHNYLPLSSTTFDNDLLLCLPEEEVQQVMMSLQPVHPLMPLDGLSNTTNGAPADFGDGQISPLDEMPNIPFGDGQIISPSLDDMPNIPVAVAEETANYDAAPAAPLVATHGTGTGQFSSNSFSLSSTTSGQFDDEEVEQAMNSLLDPSMAPDGLSNTTNGGPAARNHADAVPPLVQQDDLRHPQQQLALQQMTPTIWPSQPGSTSPTPVINPGPDEANHAASAPMGSQWTLIPAARLQRQETDILSRALTQPRAIKSRGLPSRLPVHNVPQQDGSDNLFGMGIDMIRQLGRYIGKIMKEQEHLWSTVCQHFWMSKCKDCNTFTGICQHCNTVMRTSSVEMFLHLGSCEFYNNSIHLLPASSRASKETQRSSQALQIKEIPENPNGESEPIETDNSNCTTAARVDTQGTNAVVLSPRQQHQPQMDREEQMATMLSSCEPCCQGIYQSQPASQPWESVWGFIIRLSESSCCSSTTKSTHNGFRLKFVKNRGDTKIVRVHSSAAWMHVTENRLRKDHPTLEIGTLHIAMSFNHDYRSTPAGCASSWQFMYVALCALGFRKEFARDLVIHALALVNGCYLRLWSPSSSNKGKSIVEQAGGVPSAGKRKRKPAPPRSKVWNHFTKEVETEGSKVTMARCKHCGSKLRADSATHGTTQLKRHLTSTHPDELAKSPL